MITVRLRIGLGLGLGLGLEVGSGVGLGCVSCLPRCHSRPSATALSSHVIALRSSSDMNLPNLVCGDRVRAEC